MSFDLIFRVNRFDLISVHPTVEMNEGSIPGTDRKIACNSTSGCIVEWQIGRFEAEPKNNIIPAKHPNSELEHPEEFMLAGNQFYRQPVL